MHIAVSITTRYSGEIYSERNMGVLHERYVYRDNISGNKLMANIEINKI